jgi:hypothetical protein
MKMERWTQWAEIAASLAVVVSLVFLIQQVRYNTAVLERQAVMDNAAAVNAPFVDESPLASIMAKIKAVDGPDEGVSALVDRYDLSYEEAVRWSRHLSLIWIGLEADFMASGPTPRLERGTRGLLQSKDHQVFWEFGAPQVADEEFREYARGFLPAQPEGP